MLALVEGANGCTLCGSPALFSCQPLAGPLRPANLIVARKQTFVCLPDGSEVWKSAFFVPWVVPPIDRARGTGLRRARELFK